MDSFRPPSTHQFARREGAYVFLVCAALALSVFLPLAWGGVIFHRDMAHWAYPAREFFRASVMDRGHWPGWMPLQGLGFSVYADPLYGVFYPPNWLYFLVGKEHVANLLTAQVAAHVAWGGLGIFFLTRRLGVPPKASGVASLGWMLSGFIGAQVAAGILALASAWVPWQAVGQIALLDAARVVGRRWFSGIAKAALPLALAFLLGEVFVAFLGALFGAGMLVATWIAEAHDRRARPWRVTLAWSIAMLLGFCLALPAIGPAMSAQAGTERAAPLSRSDAEACSVHPLRLLELALPHALGEDDSAYPGARIVGDKKLDGGPLTYNAYLGISILALAFVAIRRTERITLILGAGAGLALLVAFGKYLPIHAVVRRVIPPLAFMRYPEKYLLFVLAFLAPLAGMGAKRLLSGRGWAKVAGLIPVVMLVLIASWVFAPTDLKSFLVGGAMSAMLVLAALVGVGLLARRSPHLATPLLGILVGLDLANGRAGMDIWLSGREVAAMQPAAGAIHADFANLGVAGPPRLFRANAVFGATFASLPSVSRQGKERVSMATLVTNYANAFGLATLPGYDVAVAPELLRFWAASLGQGQAVLRLLSANYAILPMSEPGKPERPGLLPLLDPAPGARLYRVGNPLPRIYVPAEVISRPSPVAGGDLLSPDVVTGFRAVVSLESDLAFPSYPAPAGTCAMKNWSEDQIVAECRMDHAGLVVFVEQYAKGWAAFVDGTPTSITRTNLFMRGVAVPEGNHRVELKFSPPGLAASLTAGIAGWMVIAGLLLVGRARKPRESRLQPGGHAIGPG